MYIIALAVSAVWMTILLIRKRRLSWHSIITAYSIGVFGADVVEVSFNLLLNLYKFPTHLAADPTFENEWGIIFSDTLILPFSLIVFLHYAKKEHPWRSSLPFIALAVALESIFLITGYLKYIHWNQLFSALAYVIALNLVARNAPRIADYDPPLPYRFRLLCFSHTIIMWVGAAFSLPILKMYQFKPGIFSNIMADCRFADLLSGDVLTILCVIFIPLIPRRVTAQKSPSALWRPWVKTTAFAVIACIGTAFGLYAYYNGWLIYNNWNHVFMALRYFVPLFLIMLYDRWELSYKLDAAGKRPAMA
jgi:hypothetical protein